MIGIRKFIKQPNKWPFVGIVLVMALAMVLGAGTASAIDPRPCPDATDPPASDALGTVKYMYAADIPWGSLFDPDNDLFAPRFYNGALWDYFPSAAASGTGVFDTYLAVSHHGDEQAYNTGLKGDHCTDYDVQDSKTDALPLSAVPVKVIDMDDGNGPIAYREFVCDVNEVSGLPRALLTLEVLQIWQSDNPNLCGTYLMDPDYKFDPLGPRLVYDLDCQENLTLVLDYGVNNGSGKPDYQVYIPNDWFDQNLLYVVMVVDHGNNVVSIPGSDAEAGFEEWGVKIVECTDLSIDKTAPAGPLCPGSAITYTLVVTNNGPVAADSVYVVDTLPAGVTVTGVEVDGTPTADYSLVAGVLTYPASGGFPLAVDASITIEIFVTAPTDACDDTLVNSATVYAITPYDCDLTNNTDTASTYVGDTTDPVLANLPAGGDLGCNPTPPECDTGVTASDNCDGDISEDVECTAGDIEVDGCYREQTFTYYVEDECGNNDTEEVTYTWKEDTTDPVLPTLPAGGDLGCSEPPSCVNGLNATDNCDGEVPVICTPGPITGETCNWAQTFTYWAVDACGNNASAEVTYTWKEPECCMACETACAAQGPGPGQYRFTGASSWFTYIKYYTGTGHNSPGTAQEFPIFAGQTQRVGTLYVYNSGDTLYVKYSNTGAEPGCSVYFNAYHLQVDDEYDGFRSTILFRRNPVPGQCEYGGSLSNVPETGWIAADISGYGDNDVYIFAHSIACYSCDD